MRSFKTAALTLGLVLSTGAGAVESRKADVASKPRQLVQVKITAEDRQAFLTYRARLDELERTEAAVPAQGLVAPATDPGACLLYRAGAEGSPAQDCLRCHDGSAARAHLQTTHPVDFDYAGAQYRNRDNLRPEAEVLRRGGFLPDGKVRCTTCHDARSPWAAKINLPPGAKARPAVSPSNPGSYGDASSIQAAEPAPGSEVSPKPLCLLCHSFD